MSIHRLQPKPRPKAKPATMPKKPTSTRITNQDIIPIINNLIVDDIQTVLDIGCGRLYPPFDSTNHDILASCFGHYKITGIDICEDCIEWRRKNGPVGEYFVRDAKLLRPDQLFDLVLAHHVIEHLDKKDGQSLLDTIEKIATKQIIIGAPVGFSDNHGMEAVRKNQYEKHLCGWTPQEFEQMGYKTIVVKNVFVATKVIST